MSKIVKKITKPISKGLDKIIPNELKPALPYLAAFAPYMLPGGGIFSSMIGRGLGSAGANAFSQLAQEGNEGELNALSLLLAGGQGALTAPGDATRGIKSASETFRGKINPGEAVGIPGGNMPGQGMGGFKYDTSGLTGLDKAKNFMLKGGVKLADLAGDAQKTLSDPFAEGVTLEELAKAGATPTSLATGDLAYADAMRTKKDFDRDEAARMVQDAAFKAGMDQEYIDSITESMTKYGYNQDEINEILEVHGFDINMANGGRVGLREGGLSMLGQMNLLGNNQSQITHMGPQPGLGGGRPFPGMGGGNNSPIFPRLDELQSGVSKAENSLQDINGRLGAPNGGLQSVRPGLMGLYRNNPAVAQPAVDTSMMNRQASGGSLVPLMNGGRVEFGMGGDIMDGIMNMISKESKDPDFGGIPEAVDNIQNESKEYLFDNKLKFEVGPGENEQMSVLNALFADEEGIIPEDRKQQYYNLYINDLYRNGEMPRSDYDGYIEEGILTKPKYNMGGSVLPQGMEMDYRQGGFIPMGSAERADDVPARVSKNEFVMTADAVRAAGGGSVNKGAQKMYQLMNNLEAKA
jgi:hypothetical protein